VRADAGEGRCGQTSAVPQSDGPCPRLLVGEKSRNDPAHNTRAEQRAIGHPACEFIGWPKNADGKRWCWTFHLLRHVFAAWALDHPNIRIEDVS
jgi:hypothetical protein